MHMNEQPNREDEVPACCCVCHVPVTLSGRSSRASHPISVYPGSHPEFTPVVIASSVSSSSSTSDLPKKIQHVKMQLPRISVPMSGAPFVEPAPDGSDGTAPCPQVLTWGDYPEEWLRDGRLSGLNQRGQGPPSTQEGGQGHAQEREAYFDPDGTMHIPPERADESGHGPGTKDGEKGTRGDKKQWPPRPLTTSLRSKRALRAPPKYDPRVMECWNCGKTAVELGKKLVACSRCSKALYCSRECQKEDWTHHRRFCSPDNEVKAYRFHQKVHKEIREAKLSDGAPQIREVCGPAAPVTERTETYPACDEWPGGRVDTGVFLSSTTRLLKGKITIPGEGTWEGTFDVNGKLDGEHCVRVDEVTKLKAEGPHFDDDLHGLHCKLSRFGDDAFDFVHEGEFTDGIAHGPGKQTKRNQGEVIGPHAVGKLITREGRFLNALEEGRFVGWNVVEDEAGDSNSEAAKGTPTNMQMVDELGTLPSDSLFKTEAEIQKLKAKPAVSEYVYDFGFIVFERLQEAVVFDGKTFTNRYGAKTSWQVDMVCPTVQNFYAESETALGIVKQDCPICTQPLMPWRTSTVHNAKEKFPRLERYEAEGVRQLVNCKCKSWFHTGCLKPFMEHQANGGRCPKCGQCARREIAIVPAPKAEQDDADEAQAGADGGEKEPKPGPRDALEEAASKTADISRWYPPSTWPIEKVDPMISVGELGTNWRDMDTGEPIEPNGLWGMTGETAG